MAVCMTIGAPYLQFETSSPGSLPLIPEIGSDRESKGNGLIDLTLLWHGRSRHIYIGTSFVAGLSASVLSPQWFFYLRFFFCLSTRS